MAYSESATIVDTIFRASCGSNTDVTVRQAYNSASVLGSVSCVAYNTDNNLCDRIDYVINYQLIDQYANNTSRGVAHTVCHETGHTLSLSHYPGPDPPSPMTAISCMRSGLWDTGAAWQTIYRPHEINQHINAHWNN